MSRRFALSTSSSRWIALVLGQSEDGERDQRSERRPPSSIKLSSPPLLLRLPNLVHPTLGCFVSPINSGRRNTYTLHQTTNPQPTTQDLAIDMASTLNGSSCSRSAACFEVVQSSSLIPRQTAAVVVIPRRRNVLPAIRAVAIVAPAAPAAPLLRPATVRRSPSVSDTLARLMAKGKTALIPYITAGDPDLATTAEALRVLDACGADVIELGVPCSDPYVDGPTIQASSARALATGATMEAVLAMLEEVTPELSCPVVLFSYYKPITLCGGGLARIKDAGVHGLIVPDLPYVAAHALWSEAKDNNLELVLLTTPAIPEERMKEITKASEGFVYLVSVNGVTGPRENVNPQVESLIQEIKKVTNKPVAVGFGISKPEYVKQIAEWGADGVIIGSAMVRQLGEAASPKEGLRRLEAYARSIKSALP